MARTQSNMEKYVVRNPIIEGQHAKRIAINGNEHWPELGYWLRWNYIVEPHVMERPHAHDYDQVFHIFGGDASNITDFQAEVIVNLGDEQITLTEPAIIFIPRGTMHCPVIFKRVDKPIIWMNVALVKGEYLQTLPSGEKEPMPPGEARPTLGSGFHKPSA
jgi:hypothetical protein